MFKLFFYLFFATASTYEISSDPKPYFVGELGAAWEFPSDHLPRGATVGNFHIAFWNILNKDYLFHIEENTQGLKGSAIMRDNVVSDSLLPLTVREMLTVRMIFEMIQHPTHPRALIALQETHQDIQQYLNEHLPSNWRIITPPEQSISQDLFLYDSDRFEYVSISAAKYSSQHSKTIFTLTLREKASDKVFRFLQSHIPGGPVNSVEGCRQFSEEALKQYDPKMTILLMGDMNQSPSTIERALEDAAKEMKIEQPYHYVPIAHPSHMNTKLQAAWIDNFLSYSPDTIVSGSNEPEELLEALNPIINLLDKDSL